jgi:TrmH family RNA methyltransferase
LAPLNEFEASRQTAGKSSKIVALARSLNQRAGRVAVGKFLAQGPQTVEYGLRARQIEAVLFTEDGLLVFGDLERRAHDQAIAVYVIDERTSKVIAGTNSPQGVTAIATLPQVVADRPDTKARFVVILEQAQDPGNVGTIIRTADAAGADLVILGPGSADPYGPKCVRASAGSVFGVRIAATDSPIAEIDAARLAGLSVLATAADGELSVFDDGALARFAPPVMWVFGNEARGLDPATREACDEAVSIPILGGAESMNVAAAAAICLFTSARAANELG